MSTTRAPVSRSRAFASASWATSSTVKSAPTAGAEPDAEPSPNSNCTGYSTPDSASITRLARNNSPTRSSGSSAPTQPVETTALTRKALQATEAASRAFRRPGPFATSNTGRPCSRPRELQRSPIEQGSNPCLRPPIPSSSLRSAATINSVESLVCISRTWQAKQPSRDRRGAVWHQP